MTAYIEGFNAAVAGLPVTHNPYVETNASYMEWLRGWYDYKP